MSDNQHLSHYRSFTKQIEKGNCEMPVDLNSHYFQQGFISVGRILFLLV